MQPDLSPVIGWQTGRASEPAFMDMNLHSLRGNSTPSVVLYQSDLSDPMNAQGLLIAYAEREVKPVCSDFDTFTVGSTNMKYDPMPPKYLDLVHWSLDHTKQLLEKPEAQGWMGRWLGVLKSEAAKGFHPEFPEYGFGDPTSYGLISRVVEATMSCGAVRHGAECFNFYFPQDLDDVFLIVWDGFENPPWRSVSEPELREFLLARCVDGYSFPLNPVWPVRDPGWHALLKAQRATPDGERNLHAWFGASVLERIEDLHSTYPDGFQVLAKPELPPLSPGMLGREHTHLKTMLGGAVLALNMRDLTDTREMADMVYAEVSGEVKGRWRRVRSAFRLEAELRRMRKRVGAAPNVSTKLLPPLPSKASPRSNTYSATATVAPMVGVAPLSPINDGTRS